MAKRTDRKRAKTVPKAGRLPAPASLTLRYGLLSLPTAQHKAGLAGLLLLLDALGARNRGPLPCVVKRSSTDVEVTLTQDSLQTVMDDLYDATHVEVLSKSKWKGKEPIREEEVVEADPTSGKSKKTRRYVYGAVQPRGGFLETAAFGNLAAKPYWMKLWRDVIWGTVRGIPTTRNPYNERAAGKPAAGGGVSEIWEELTKEQAARSKNLLRTMPVASSIRLGAQDHNAETVPFQGSPAETLLLHLWVAVMLCFVPQGLDKEGNITTGEGFIIAIPEVSNLIEFAADFREVLANLSPDNAGYRPAEALVCMPQEGALAFLRLLLARVKNRLERDSLRYSVSGVEVYHLHKPGNTVMTLAADRIGVDSRLVTGFERIHRKTHPLLRAQLIRNLLSRAPWYRGFHRSASTTDANWLVAHGGAKGGTGRFCRDVRKQFDTVLDRLTDGGTV